MLVYNVRPNHPIPLYQNFEHIGGRLWTNGEVVVKLDSIIHHCKIGNYELRFIG